MAYKLTLTKSERVAFDWNGNRYSSSGDDVSNLLCENMADDVEWSQNGDITFDIPESVAWQIDQYAREENYRWPNFGTSLLRKMQRFCDSIV